MKVKRMAIREILRRIWLFSANKMKISESVSKQPTQLIIVAHNCHIRFLPFRSDVSKGSFGNNCIMLGKRRDNCTKGINEFSVADVTTLLIVTVLKESSLSLVQSSELPASILRLYTR